MSQVNPEVCLIRHGETVWTSSGQHTGRTDNRDLSEPVIRLWNDVGR